jgi:hypothetical protein
MDPAPEMDLRRTRLEGREDHLVDVEVPRVDVDAPAHGSPESLLDAGRLELPEGEGVGRDEIGEGDDPPQEPRPHLLLVVIGRVEGPVGPLEIDLAPEASKTQEGIREGIGLPPEDRRKELHGLRIGNVRHGCISNISRACRVSPASSPNSLWMIPGRSAGATSLLQVDPGRRTWSRDCLK